MFDECFLKAYLLQNAQGWPWKFARDHARDICTWPCIRLISKSAKYLAKDLRRLRIRLYAYTRPTVLPCLRVACGVSDLSGVCLFADTITKVPAEPSPSKHPAFLVSTPCLEYPRVAACSLLHAISRTAASNCCVLLRSLLPNSASVVQNEEISGLEATLRSSQGSHSSRK